MKKIISLLLVAVILTAIIPFGTLNVSADYDYLFPVRYFTITYGYGYSSPDYGSWHTGIDIVSSEDNTVYAAYDGVVIKAANSCDHWNDYGVGACDHYNDYGNCIKVQQDDGIDAIYGHLTQNSLLVSVGDRVTKGQPIAVIGSSGCSSGPHLHFELRPHGGDISTAMNTNPVSWGGGAYIDYSYVGYGTPASQPDPITYSNIPEGQYYIKNKSNGEYMSVSEGIDANEQNVNTWTFLVGAEFQMNLTKASSGYKIRPQCSSSRLINAYGSTVVSGNNVNLYDDWNESSQWWGFEETSDGGYIIRNMMNENCVLTLVDGCDVKVYNYTGADTQIWYLEETSSSDTQEPLPEYGVAIDNSNNLAYGKPYTSTEPFRQGGADVNWAYDANADIAWPDEGGCSLTDGYIANTYYDYLEPSWVGYNSKSPYYSDDYGSYVEINLGAEYNIAEVTVYVGTEALGADAGLHVPERIEFWIDGFLYNPEVVVYPSESTEPQIAVTADLTGCKASYVGISLISTGWAFISEITVAENLNPSDDTSYDDTSYDDTSYDDTSSDDTSFDDTSSDDTSFDDTSSDDTSSDDTSTDNTNAFQANISVPEAYIPGEMLYVTVTVDNITAENGLHSVGYFHLLFDNSKLDVVPIESSYTAIDAFQGYAEWEDMSRFDTLGDGTVIVKLSAATAGTADGTFTEANQDGQLIFIVPFYVHSDATGTLEFTIEDTTVVGIYIDEQNGNIYEYTGIGSAATVMQGSSDNSDDNEDNNNSQTEELIDEQGLVYTLNDDEMYGGNGDAYIVTGYKGSSASVVIPSEYNGLPVAEIGIEAFWHCEHLIDIVIPNTVTYINYEAFYQCINLTNVNIPDSVIGIGYEAFFHCESLTNVEIPDSVQGISDWAFSGCDSLTNITIGNSVDEMGNYTFAYCDNLANVEIPVSVKKIGKNTFNECNNLTDIYCEAESQPSGWDENWLDNCNATVHWGYSNSQNPENPENPEQTYTDSQGVTYTLSDDGTYYTVTDCDQSVISVVILAKIDGIPVKNIGDNAFYCRYDLTNVEIPDSVTSIGWYAFCGCTSLTSIEIPNSVTSLGSYAFYGSSLTSVVIGSSVRSIADRAFGNCSSLESITVESGNEYYHSIDNCIIETATNTLIVGCKNSIIPNSVTSIGNNAFDGNRSLISIKIPNSVTSVGDYAFGDCRSLTSIEIPNSVTSIGDDAFYGCENLTAIYCEAESQPSGWDENWLRGCQATVHWGYKNTNGGGNSNDPVEPETNVGDINGNDKIDMTDYILLKRAYFGTFKFNDAQNISGDINKNGKIDMTDYILLKRVYFGTYTIK